MNVPLKKRTRWQRLIRLPKVIKVNMEFTKQAPLRDRILFTWTMIKIIMK